MTVARVSPEVNIQTSIEIYRNIGRARYIRKPDVPVIYGSKTRPGKERVPASAPYLILLKTTIAPHLIQSTKRKWQQWFVSQRVCFRSAILTNLFRHICWFPALSAVTSCVCWSWFMRALSVFAMYWIFVNNHLREINSLWLLFGKMYCSFYSTRLNL